VGPLIAAPGGGSHGSCPSQFSIFVTIAAMSRLAALAAKLQALACHTMQVVAVLEKCEQGASTRAARRWSPALQRRPPPRRPDAARIGRGGLDGRPRPDELTPREALDLLYRLKALVAE
jgi:hypothetical protein